MMHCKEPRRQLLRWRLDFLQIKEELIQAEQRHWEPARVTM